KTYIGSFVRTNISEKSLEKNALLKLLVHWYHLGQQGRHRVNTAAAYEILTIAAPEFMSRRSDESFSSSSFLRRFATPTPWRQHFALAEHVGSMIIRYVYSFEKAMPDIINA